MVLMAPLRRAGSDRTHSQVRSLAALAKCNVVIQDMETNLGVVVVVGGFNMFQMLAFFKNP